MRLMLSKKINPKRISQVKETFNTTLRVLKLYWQTSKTLFIGNLITHILIALLPFALAYSLKLLIDFIVVSITSGSPDISKLIPLIGLLIGMSFLQRITFSIDSYINRLTHYKFPVFLYEKVLTKMSGLDLQYFEDSSFRDTLQKVRDSYTYRPINIINFSFNLFAAIVQLTVALIAILKLSPFVALLLVLVSIPDFYNQITYSRKGWFIWGDNSPYFKKYNYLTELILAGQSIKELKIFQTGGRFLKELSGVQQKFYNESRALFTRKLGTDVVFSTLDTFVVSGVFIFIVFEAIAKRISIGDISFYQSVFTSFNSGIGGLFRNVSNLFEQSLYVKHIFDLFDVENQIKFSQNPTIVAFKKPINIEFKDVTFKYPGTRAYILKNFSIVIKPGEKIAFVGENGAGKTTIIKLLARFYDVDSGHILINGIDIKDLDLESWYKAMGVLFQDFIKYEYPVKENIFFGKVWEKEDINEIIEAAKSAGAHDMIKTFDNEYDQMLGRTFEGGLELSGGQWQKVALARAFLRNAPVLILDEPTSAIDARAEAEIFNKVQKLAKDKTVIIISHRFSTVRNADRIYVIDKGKIIEQGSHEELIKINGEYSTLFKLQARGYQ